MIRLLIILVLLQGCVSTPTIIEEDSNDQPMEVSTKVLLSTTGEPIAIVVQKNAVDVQEVMALKEVLEKVVDLQKKEGEE